MVASIGSHRHGHIAVSKPSANDDVQPILRGKSADSVGHRAKAEIALYSEEVDVPANIRGKVASMIARNEFDRAPSEPEVIAAPEELTEPDTTPEPDISTVVSDPEIADTVLVPPAGDPTSDAS